MADRTLSARLLAARQKMRDPRLTGKNPHFNSAFVPRDEVLQVVNEALWAEGLFLTQGIHAGALMTRVHDSDEYLLLCEYPVPDLADPQKLAASMTYASRISLMLAFALAGEPDDDGNTAAAPTPQRGDVTSKAPAKYSQNGMGVDTLPTSDGLDAVIEFVKSSPDPKTRGKAVKQALGVPVDASIAQMRKAWDGLDEKEKGHVMAAAIGKEQ